MPLLIDILVWATAHLSPWQRDTLRRLFQQRELTNQDIDDLYALLKSASGISDHRNRQPIPLTQAHLPAQLGNSQPVILKAMRELKHVNRIAPGQKLDFAPHLFGSKWTSATANPANAALADSGNWAAACNDTREILCSVLIHNATAA